MEQITQLVARENVFKLIGDEKLIKTNFWLNYNDDYELQFNKELYSFDKINGILLIFILRYYT